MNDLRNQIDNLNLNIKYLINCKKSKIEIEKELNNIFYYF